MSRNNIGKLQSVEINELKKKQANRMIASEERTRVEQAGRNDETATVAAAEVDTAVANAEEDDESGEDTMKMWLDVLTAVESAPDPALRAVLESDSDGVADDVELNERSSLSRYVTPNITNYAQENPS
jgi:hypothetical protein